MVLPMLKLGSLFIKSLAKPFSKQIKSAASKSPGFHDKMVKMARVWHRFDLKLSKFTGETTRRAAELNVNAAIDLGAEIASEAFLLSVAMGLLVYENSRSSEKEKKKEEALQNRFKTLQDKIDEQNETIEKLANCIEILSASNPNLNVYINDPSLPHQSSTLISNAQSTNDLNKSLYSIKNKKIQADLKENQYSSLSGSSNNNNNREVM